MKISQKDIPLFLFCITMPTLFGIAGIAFLARGDIGAFLIAGVGTLFSGILLLGMFRLRRSSGEKSEIETGRKEIDSRTCNVSIGAMGLSWPFWRVTVYDGFLILKGNRQIVFQPQDILNLVISQALLQQRLEIVHQRKDVDRPVYVSTVGGISELKDKIESGLRLREMPQFGKEPVLEGMSDQERKERKKYPWLL